MYNNRISLTGNLTKNPEYKSISDRNLVHFRIAVNENIGNSKEETIYMDIDGWGGHASYAKNVNLSKGDRVMITGRLRQKNWEKDGIKRTDVTVVPRTFSKLVRPSKPSV